jgi:hypothetical protein
MPTWHDKPEDTLHDVLTKVFHELNEEVSTQPSFEAVTGLPMDKLTNHAAQAIMSYFSDSDEADPTNPLTWIRLYCMAFVVGLKYGETIANQSHERQVTWQHPRTHP